ncbi:MAG: O-antigen ligase family protein [Proteobacteria bacterium]|nr:O-antigen ligase family protein [Pseudomonadota bacterium]
MNAIGRMLPTLAPRLPAALMVFTTGYAGMLLTNNLVWPRSLFFALMCAAALLTAITQPAAALAHLRRAGPVLWVVLAWALWCTASLAWTIEPRFSLREWETEIQYGIFVFVATLVAVRDPRDARTLVAAPLLAFAALGVAAVVMTAATGAFDPTRWHHDVGIWSTHLVLVAPLLLFLPFAPATARGRRYGVAAFVVLLALLLVNARLTDNRIVWIAFAAVYGLAGAAIAWRGRRTGKAVRPRHVVMLALLFTVLTVLFANVVRDKAEMYYPPSMSVSQVLENDPRIALWKRVVDKIEAAPWLGYGFGRGILRDELPAELNNLALTHPHNTLVGQWLETGCIGLALYLAMLGILLWRHAEAARSVDRLRGLIGIVGVALVVGFTVKNLTDDFFIRSNAKLFWVLNATLLAAAAMRANPAADTRLRMASA